MTSPINSRSDKPIFTDDDFKQPAPVSPSNTHSKTSKTALDSCFRKVAKKVHDRTSSTSGDDGVVKKVCIRKVEPGDTHFKMRLPLPPGPFSLIRRPVTSGSSQPLFANQQDLMHLPLPSGPVSLIGKPVTSSSSSSSFSSSSSSSSSAYHAMPDPSAFVDPKQSMYGQGRVHKELARAEFGSSSISKVCPPTPRPVKSIQAPKYASTPFIKNAQVTRALIEGKLAEKAAGTFESFQLEVAPGMVEMITDVSFLSDQGRNSVAYRCEVAGKGSWVLKLYKDNILYGQPDQAVIYAANQLFRYAQNRKHPLLQHHVAEHRNFEPYLGGVDHLLSEKNTKTRFYGFVDFVSKYVEQGFLFVPFIPNNFPSQAEFNPEDTRWKQLKAMMHAGVDATICNDLRRDNIKTMTVLNEDTGVSEERVVCFDLLEIDGDEDEPIPYITEFRSTFTSNAEHQKWLFDVGF